MNPVYGPQNTVWCCCGAEDASLLVGRMRAAVATHEVADDAESTGRADRCACQGEQGHFRAIVVVASGAVAYDRVRLVSHTNGSRIDPVISFLFYIPSPLRKPRHRAMLVAHHIAHHFTTAQKKNEASMISPHDHADLVSRTPTQRP